jgi:transcriptional regulator of acetoin/glycerol metabolism
MNKIYDFVKGSNFFSILTDKDGCILNVIGDEDILSEAFSFKMIPGAYMDEESIGTNAMGTAIAESAPLQLSGKEHYVSAYHRWTCSASPIKDPDGNIIGVLDLTGYSESVHSHTLGMVVAAARVIEKVLESNRFESMLLKEKNYYEEVQNSLMIGIIITEIEGIS